MQCCTMLMLIRSRARAHCVFTCARVYGVYIHTNVHYTSQRTVSELDKELIDLLDEAPAVSKGMGGAVVSPTRSATRGGGTRGGGGESQQEKEKVMLQHAAEDLHSFRGTSGFWTCG